MDRLKKFPNAIVQNINSIHKGFNIPKIFNVLINIGYLIACVEILIDEDDEIEIEEFYEVIKNYKEDNYG